MINIEIYVKLFFFSLRIELKFHSFNPFPKRSKVKDADKPQSYLDAEELPSNEELLSDLKSISPITLKAEQFERELQQFGIYDIPDTSDMPPRFNIADDVEIITDSYEKEIEDVIEGRR